MQYYLVRASCLLSTLLTCISANCSSKWGGTLPRCSSVEKCKQQAHIHTHTLSLSLAHSLTLTHSLTHSLAPSQLNATHVTHDHTSWPHAHACIPMYLLVYGNSICKCTKRSSLSLSFSTPSVLARHKMRRRKRPCVYKFSNKNHTSEMRSPGFSYYPREAEIWSSKASMFTLIAPTRYSTRIQLCGEVCERRRGGRASQHKTEKEKIMRTDAHAHGSGERTNERSSAVRYSTHLSVSQYQKLDMRTRQENASESRRERTRYTYNSQVVRAVK